MGNQASQSSKSPTSSKASSSKVSSQSTTSTSDGSSNSDFIIDTISKFGLLDDIRNVACDNVFFNFYTPIVATYSSYCIIKFECYVVK